MSGPEAKLSRLLPGALRVLAVACSFVYFAQYLTVPPNSSEGAVMMDYVHRLSEGQRLHFDVFDYYGPVAWLPYSAFYLAFGQQMIGVRALLLLLKLGSVLLTYALIAGLGRRSYAVLGALTVAVLIGQPWPFFQTPYAPHLTFPMMLGVWLLVFPAKPRPSRVRLIAAGFVTGLILWTKVNTGAYVMAGIAVYLACWAPLGSAYQSSASGRRETLPAVLQVLGLVLVAVGFHAFLLPHINALYAVYLALPLTLGIAWTLQHVVQAWWMRRSAKPLVGAACIYLASTLFVWGFVFIAYFGIEAGPAYVSEQLAVLSRFHYQVALPRPGASGQYRGFNEYFWPQLPWLTTATAVYWLLTRRRRLAANELRTADAEARLAGLFLAGTLYVFVIYARGDEVHLVQGVLGAAVVLFGMFAVIDGAPRARQSAGVAARWGVAAVTVLAATTLVALPRGIDFYPTFGDWGSPRLAYLRYHGETNEREQELSVGIPYDEWDAHIDATAMQVDQLTQDGEEVLVLGGAQLINYASNTRPAGGKYSHFFYLLRCGLLDRAAFIELMPRQTRERLLSSPPRVVVWQGGDDDVLRALPELKEALRRTPYRFVNHWGPFAVWVRPTP